MRAAKRRIDELDLNIKPVSKLLRNFTSSKTFYEDFPSGLLQPHIEMKLLNAKLKEKRLQALCAISEAQKMLCQLDKLIAENEFKANMEALNNELCDARVKKIDICDDDHVDTLEKMFTHSTPIKTSPGCQKSHSTNHYNNTNELIQDLIDTTPSVNKNYATLYTKDINKSLIENTRTSPGLECKSAAVNQIISKRRKTKNVLSKTTQSLEKKYETLHTKDINETFIENTRTKPALESNCASVNPTMRKTKKVLLKTTPSLDKKYTTMHANETNIPVLEKSRPKPTLRNKNAALKPIIKNTRKSKKYLAKTTTSLDRKFTTVHSKEVNGPFIKLSKRPLDISSAMFNPILSESKVAQIDLKPTLSVNKKCKTLLSDKSRELVIDLSKKSSLIGNVVNSNPFLSKTNQSDSCLSRSTPSVGINCATLHANESNELILDLSKTVPPLSRNNETLKQFTNKTSQSNITLLKSTPSVDKKCKTTQAKEINGLVSNLSNISSILERDDFTLKTMTDSNLDLFKKTPSIVRKRATLPSMADKESLVRNIPKTHQYVVNLNQNYKEIYFPSEFNTQKCQ